MKPQLSEKIKIYCEYCETPNSIWLQVIFEMPPYAVSLEIILCDIFFVHS
jgi:hypothetical protein